MKDELAKAFEAGRRAERADAVKYIDQQAESYKDSYCYHSDVYSEVWDLSQSIEFGYHLSPELKRQLDVEIEEKERREATALAITDAVMALAKAKAEQAESAEVVAIAQAVLDAALLGSGVAGGLAYDAACAAVGLEVSDEE